MKYSKSVTQLFASTALTLISLQTFAGPGTLVSSPLFVDAAAKPNIIFLTDTSGSMRHVVPEDGAGAADMYDSGTTYISSCGAATVPNDTTTGSPDSLYIRIVGNVPKISYARNSGPTYFLGTSSGEICFSTNLIYNATLNADAGNNAVGSATATYTGNYLNWYFDYNNTSTVWNSGQEYKPGTDYRMNITRTTLKSIVTNLDDTVRIGLATLNGSSGATIDYEVADLTGTTTTGVKQAILNEIDTFDQGGSTPMAEALHQVGHYFLGDAGTTNATAPYNGQYSGNLILHPNDATPETQTSATVFPTPYSPGGYESPIQYWCQNNFVVFMSDGISRADYNIPTRGTGITPTILADYDRDCVGNANCNTDNDQKLTGSYIYDPSDGSDYLDDVAQALFEMDLRPDIDQPDPDNPGSFVEATNNIITYTIAFADTDALNNKLLEDAATQAGGEYFTSSDASELAQDFASATNSILATTSSASAVTFNTNTLGSDTALYQATFSTAFWSGEIYSYPINPANGAISYTCTLDVDPNCWQASTHVDALAYNSGTSTFVDNREIITLKKTITAGVVTTHQGIPFTTPSDFTAPTTLEISSTMINDFCAGPDAPLVSSVACTSTSASAKADSQQYVDRMIDYIRGDRTFENVTTTPEFRTRLTVLGDIINAAPVFAGAPSLGWPSTEVASNAFGETGKRYSDFQAAQINRDSVLYVSSNEGMLHAFRTKADASATSRGDDGDELFAYIPSFVFSDQANQGLHYLADPNYRHKYYLDLSPTFSDVYTRGKDSSNTTTYATTASDWRTVLVGGSRGGEKIGIFAMDVTNPTSITESNAADIILWEFTNSDDADLGQTYSKPNIALTNAVGSDGLNRWAVIFGNGYQNDTSVVSNGSSCTAQLFVVFIDGGLDGTWSYGTNPSTADYMKIDTEVGTTTAGNCNGLSTPALIDTDGDSIVDRVYAGDIQGNMWAFDLTCGGSCSFDVDYQSAGSPQPLFAAYDSQATAERQPITSKPSVVRNTAVTTTASNEPNLLILFGTGQYHASGDTTGTDKINSFYAIYDSGSGGINSDRSTLVEQVLTTNAANTLRTVTSNALDWTTDDGWFIDLDGRNTTTLDAEERVVVNSAVRSNIVFFNTLKPNSEVCGFGGYGWLMSVNFLTGSVTAGVNIFDFNGDGTVNAGDTVSQGNGVAVGAAIDGIPADSSFIDDRQYTQTSAGGGSASGGRPAIDERVFATEKTQTEGRLSWRELRSDY